MGVETKTEVVCTLERAKAELQSLSRTTESGIESIARTFESLAGHTDTILNLAEAMVGCIENESVSSVLPRVQTLGAAARRFIGDRLRATTGIMAIVQTEVNLLRRLARVTGGQEAMAFESKALSVLTNIEVARLGAVGAGFQYLAHELADFSKSVTADAFQLASQTDGRKAEIEQTGCVLAAELPRLQEELGRIELELGRALSEVTSTLTQLSQTPVQLRACVVAVAQQIAGVVSAVQANDITRQQIEHVQEGLAAISARIHPEGNTGNESAPEVAQAYAGLTIQIYQLRTIQETIASWVSQIRTCMRGILRISASEVVGICPMVIEQERELSFQLAQIERLERESQAYSERIQRAFGGLSSLMQLVNEHLKRSQAVRDHLQLLTFNSIIEASRLGTKAAAILAIAQSIKGISAEWSRITDQSGQVMQEVLDLEKQAKKEMEAFSDASDDKLREAQAHTRAGLEDFRTAAEFATGRAQEMKTATDEMQAKTAEVSKTVDLLDAAFMRIGAVLTEIEGIKNQVELENPGVKERYDAVAAEQLFSASYTTEIEREVLRAALRGAALPVAQQTFAGNSVELF